MAQGHMMVIPESEILSAQYFLYLFVENTLRGGANLLIHHLAVLDEEHTRDAGNAIVDREVWVLVHIHLAYIYLAVIFFRKGVNRRAEGKARAAPWRPEIYYRKLISFEHFSVEI